MSIAAIFDGYEEDGSSQWFGSYRIVNRIAEGGTAYVFRAEDPETGDAVALKTVRSGLSHEIAVLAREITVLRALRHPGIVRFVADGTCDGMPWMAIELLEGRSLFAQAAMMWEQENRRANRRDANGRDGNGRDRNGRDGNGRDDRREDRRSRWRVSADRRQGPATVRLPTPEGSTASEGNWLFSMQEDPLLAFPVRRAAAGSLPDVLTWIMSLLPALDYIHGRGVVHGDVKPPNVQLGTDGRVTLLDFGLAHRPRGGAGAFTVNGLRMGTTQYAAPEQITGEKFDATADIYSLGCILYELVTGRIPFDGGSLQDIARRQVTEEPICPSILVSGLGWELEDLIMSMLEKKPSRRPQTVRDIASRLSGLLPRCQQSVTSQATAAHL